MVARSGWKAPEELSIEADSKPLILRRDCPIDAGELAIHLALAALKDSGDMGVVTHGFSLDNRSLQMSLDGGQYET